MDATSASSLMGSTMPEVPRMEIPPTMPSRGLKVRAASASPSGTEISTTRPPVYPYSRQTVSTPSRIIFRGTGLMAGSPTGTESPGFVTRPTPTPPVKTSPGLCAKDTLAQTMEPLVISGSSPLSFTTPQLQLEADRLVSTRERHSVLPSGTRSFTSDTGLPDSSIRAAPAAAAAAHVPVVYPLLNFFCPR